MPNDAIVGLFQALLSWKMLGSSYTKHRISDMNMFQALLSWKMLGSSAEYVSWVVADLVSSLVVVEDARKLQGLLLP